MIQVYGSSDTAIGDAVTAVEAPPEPGEIASDLVSWLARVRLLQGVPFSYLVPHEQMLPRESIRFFYVNRNWLDAAVDGALSLGAATTRERALLETMYRDLRGEVDQAERNLWQQALGGTLREGAGEVITGFLLRSRMVSGWPGLEVRASRTVDGVQAPVQLLRVERLAPAVLLVLMDGIPQSVLLEEPRGGAQLGVDAAPGGKRIVTMRDPATGSNIPGATVEVPFRPGAPGVIDTRALRQRMLDKQRPEIGPDMSAAELALQLVQYPTSQPFQGAGDDPVFQASVPLAVIRASQGT
jgi:hypothetical protein